MNLYFADPAEHRTRAGLGLDDVDYLLVDRDVSHLAHMSE